jgi:predicted CxxxxCH...CXXCH cytochrome family protein
LKWPALLLLLGLSSCGVARRVDDPRCATPQACEAIHPVGIADPASPDFHGALVRSLGWNLSTCMTCHGDDFAGGRAGKSCLGCHDQGPTGCTVCHGQPPASGAHARHAGRFGCDVCHIKPTRWDEPGHLRDEAGALIDRARVTFGGLARAHGATPSWDGTRCSSTYCHGDATPAWNGGASEAGCGSCHRIPPPSHASRRCGDCHARVADSTARIVDDRLHVDGTVNVGDDSGSCAACHPLPGGAHAAHLQARHQLRAPLGCGDCHQVPAALDSPGHIDQPGAEVFPDGTSALARSDGARATWDAAAGRCSDVYCHGGGRALGADTTATIVRQPSWDGDQSAAVCGACHGVPPADAAHPAPMTLADCNRCHARTIDASGALVRGGAHLDGIIDAP